MGAYFPGRSVSLGSYPFFGVPVYAAADGTVVEASDGMDEQVPGGALKGVTVDTLPGNHIVVDMGNGNFALYAQFKDRNRSSESRQSCEKRGRDWPSRQHRQHERARICIFT